MKHLKLIKEMYIDEDNLDQYEDIIKNYKFIPGDYVELGNSNDENLNLTNHNIIYKITKINTIDSYQPYEIQSLQNGATYWYTCFDARKIPDYELDAMKYNL